MALLGSQNPAAVQEAAAGALGNILGSRADNQTRVTAASAIPSLVALLGTHNFVGVQKLAAQNLGNLAVNANNQAAFRSDPHAFSSLSKLRSTSASVEVRQVAERALQILNTAPSRSIRHDKLASELIAAEDEEEVVKAAAAVNPISALTSFVAAASFSTAAVNSASLTTLTASSVAATLPSASASQQLPPRPRKSCWSCGTTGVPLKKCAVCAVAVYCGAGCQKADWKAHKGQCAGLKAGATSSGAG